MQSLVKGPLRIEGGLRVEFSKVDADADADLGTPAMSRKFTTFSGSLGAAYDLSPGWRAGVTLSRSARAPSIDELFANGPHAGTQAFEVGNPDLDPEKSIGIEASVRKHSRPAQADRDGLLQPLLQLHFPGADRRRSRTICRSSICGRARPNYYGFEVEADAELGNALGVHWGGELLADDVHAKVKDFGPAPQIPPLRLLGGISGSAARSRAGSRSSTPSARAATRRSKRRPTAIRWSMRPRLAAARRQPKLTLGIAANNIFDVVARRHSSLLKDYAPLAGRDIRLTARFGF